MKIVVFTLNEREYALDVTQVREVIRITTILPLPDVPSWIEGIINLRGKIIPILSLPRKLNIGTQNQSDLNRVIMDRVNATGEVFLSHTVLHGRFCLRIALGNLKTRKEHLERTWALLREASVG